MTTTEILNCQFQLWYPHFKNITIESVVINISQACLNFLKSDGILIPLGYSEGNIIKIDQEKHVVMWMKNIDWNIKELGGYVFPKLNWSSPKDAVWISPDKSLKCSDANEVILLLKSSDYITHDLFYPFDDCLDRENMNSTPITYHIILRRWKDFSSFSELRCFVRDRNLIAISQRHTDTYVPFLNIKRDSIINDIRKFYIEYINDIFPSDNYTFDIFHSDGKEIFLLDFNPYRASTDALLFTWKYLDSLSTGSDLEFRIVENPDYGNRIRGNEFAWNAMPVDFYHLANGLDENKLEDFLQISQNQLNSLENEDDGC